MLETVAYWFVGIGVAFELLGCIGLLRLPDVYDRAVAATKCVTMGSCMMLLGVGLYGLSGETANWGMMVKALICGAFILITNPVAAHAVLRGAYISGVPMKDGGVEDAFVERAQEIRDELQVEDRRSKIEEQEQAEARSSNVEGGMSDRH